MLNSSFSLGLAMDSDPLYDDSGDAIFLTQNTFSERNTSSDLQKSQECDCPYLDSQYESNWSIPMGEVEYWDFSETPDNSSIAPSLP